MEQAPQEFTDQELEQKATDLRNNGQTEESIRVYQELVKRFSDASNMQKAAGMQHMIGVTYKVANDTEDSLSALAKAKDMYQDAGDPVGVGRVLRDEGITYQYVNEYEKARVLLEQSVAALEETDDMAELGMSQVKLGNLHTDQGNLEDAEVWLLRGLETLSHVDHWFYAATAQLHLGSLHLKRHEYPATLELIEMAEKTYKENGGESGNARRYAQMEVMKVLAYKGAGDDHNAKKHRERCQKFLDRLDEKSARYLREEPEFQEALE